MKPKLMPFILLIVTGCVQYNDQTLSPTQYLDDFESRSLDSADLQAYMQANTHVGHWPLKAWSLTDLTLAAFFYHPDLDVARARYATSQGELKIAGERPNPSISVSPAFNSTNQSDITGVSSWIVDTALDIPIETMNKRGYRVVQARRLSEAARYKIATVAWDVRSHVRQSLLEIFAARKTEAQLLQQQTIHSENVKLLQLELKAGEVSPFEVSQARIPLNAVRLAVVRAQERQTQALAKLASAIGVPLKSIEGVTLSFDAIENVPSAIPAQGARRKALLGRPDILSALAEYQAAQSDLELEIAKQYPDINIGPGYSFDQSENKWAIGISATLPIFNQNQGGILVAEGRRAEMAAKFRALQASLIGRLEQAIVDYASSTRKFKAAENLADELAKSTEVTRKMYEAGEILKLEVIAADLEMSANALARLNARIEMLKAVGDIEDALQQPLDMPRWREAALWRNTESQGETSHE